ncbi:hypothetical protein A6A04_06630 [Paramagnetospirillum marisnigri]|jgi:hypothetical protein|uniref:Uncharacterized protein n=1 Tax=Paramagnetospirillum marisnigri TaxID=1285242 RepID=A0A178M9Z5_9PROT|nr:hypothetical protein [Paramagnetospirillum marisnigri]OAN45569.1 hypothetical protein A6A04_06630 [Paramagnetospirillum marisnigri]
MDKIIKLLAAAVDPAATDPERLTAMSKIAAILNAKGIHASQLSIRTDDIEIGSSSIDWEKEAKESWEELTRLRRELSKLKTVHKRAAKPNDCRGWSSTVKANVVTDKDGYVVGSWS